MSRRTPSLARRAFPALALTAVGVGLVQGLDRPNTIGAVGSLDMNSAATPTQAGAAPADATGSVAAAQTPSATQAPASSGGTSGNAAPANSVAPQAAPTQAAPAQTAPPQTAAPVTAAPAPAAPAAPASTGTCGEVVGVGAQQAITWRKSYGVISVTAKFTASGDLCNATAQWQANDSKSQRYEEYAVPILNQQAEAADSANVQGVSGATAVTNAYRASLQSAIDNRR